MQVYILSQSFATLVAILLPLKKRFEGRGDFFLSYLSPLWSPSTDGNNMAIELPKVYTTGWNQ